MCVRVRAWACIFLVDGKRSEVMGSAVEFTFSGGEFEGEGWCGVEKRFTNFITLLYFALHCFAML